MNIALDSGEAQAKVNIVSLLGLIKMETQLCLK